VGDDYLKYLLKAAVVAAENLKRIDVVCLDPYGDVKERYERYIRFNFCRFKNATTQKYLKAIPERSSPSQPQLRAQQRIFRIDGLEKAHAQFMDR
jgi:hypothetical protein